jgi:hypothetical protein
MWSTIYVIHIFVTGRVGLWDCEMLRILHCVDDRLTDGGKVVSPTYRPLSTPQKHYFLLLVLVSDIG